MNVILGIRVGSVGWVLSAAMLVSQTGGGAQTKQSTSYLKQATISQTGRKMHITANSPRPLHQILESFQNKFGWKIDYEDPQYVSSLDVIDVVGPESAALSSGGNARYPRGGNFEVDLTTAAADSSPDQKMALQTVLDAYNSSTNPGRFELRPNPDGSSDFVGVAAHDEKGQIAKQQPVLDVAITLPAEERSVADTVDLICQKVAEQSHTPVTVGVTPFGLFTKRKTKTGGTQESARALLIKALTFEGHNFYWYLLFDPNSKGYYLDIHSLRTKQ